MKIFNKIKSTITTGELFIFLLCICLPFTHIPKYLQKAEFIVGGYFSLKLLVYPIFLLFIYYIVNGKKFQDCDKKITYFICAYILLNFIGIIYSVKIFPYYNEFEFYQNIPQKIIFIANLFNLGHDEAVFLWIFGRILRSYITYTFFTILISYILYKIFKENKFDVFKTIKLSIKVIVVMMTIYSTIEILYFMGNKVAENILTTINPQIHLIKEYHGWWPQLLLKNQLRSFFVEPSYLAMYGVVALPFLYTSFFEEKNLKIKIIDILLVLALSFFMFLTKSRMATVFMFLNISVLIFFTLLYFKNMRSGTSIILLCTFIAFSGAVIFSDKYLTTHNNISNKVTQQINGKVNQYEKILLNNANHVEKKENMFSKYMDNNVKSIASVTQRSNGTRYGVMYADYMMGKDHIFFGVGETLRNRYMIDYLPEWSKNKAETKMWIKAVQQKTMMNAGFANLNEYLYRFSTSGLIGLGLFMFPIVFLFRKIFLYFKRNKKYDLKAIIFTMAFIASCATGIGDSVIRIYWFWIILPLGYSMFFKSENNVKKDDNTRDK